MTQITGKFDRLLMPADQSEAVHTFSDYPSEDLIAHASEIAGLIRGRQLEEPHIRTIGYGLELLVAIGDKTDEENGVTRPTSHRDSLLQAWSESDDDIDSTDWGRYKLWKALIPPDNMAYRYSVLDLIDQTPCERIDVRNQIKRILQDTARGYDLTQIVRDDLSGTLARQGQARTFYEPDSDLADVYRRHTTIRHGRQRLSYRQLLEASDFYHQRAFNGTANLLKENDQPIEPDEYIEFVRAAYYIRTSELSDDAERKAMRELRLKMFEHLMAFDLPSARKAIEDMVLLNPNAVLAPAYSLIGLDKGEKTVLGGMYQPAKPGIERDSTREEKALAKALRPVIEDAIDGVILEAGRSAYENKVYEILDEHLQSTGLVFSLDGKTVTPAGSPALIKSHLAVFEGDSQATVCRYIAGRVKFSHLLKARATGRVKRYEGLNEFMAERFPEVSNFVVKSVKTETAAHQKFGHIGRTATSWHTQSVKHSFLEYLA